VRLGTCIALELALAAGAVGGVWFGMDHAVRDADHYFTSHEAAAATPTPSATPPLSPIPLPGAHLRVAAPAPSGTIFDAPDDVLLAPLGATPITRVKVNHGGTSLSLRLDFASGARAAFKPEQNHPQSDPRREIAAYRIDRLLGIGHVAPAKAVTFPIADLLAAADPAARDYTIKRITEEAAPRGGMVHGEVQWWIPEIRDATIGRFRVDETDGIALWTSYVQVGATIPADVRPLVEQLVTCVVYDVVIDNADRWTGYNTKSSPDKQTLFFMDNTLSFSIYTLGHETNLLPLRRIQVFPRRLVERLRAMTLESVTVALSAGGDESGLAPLLYPVEIRAIISRRDHLVRYIDELIAQFGENAVLALP
jgi:hypothetical protein